MQPVYAMSMPPPKSLESLSQEQQASLNSIVSTLCLDKIVVSFSIEDRDMTGRKKSAFYCVTGSRGPDSDGVISGYTLDEAKLAHCLLSKHVLAVTYLDAVTRGILPVETARTELQNMNQVYDNRIVKLLGGLE